MRRFGAIAGIAFSLTAATPGAGATLQYPPDVYFNFGSAFVGTTANVLIANCVAFLVSSQFRGTGGNAAIITFSQTINYEYTPKSTQSQSLTAQMGGSAFLDFASPASGTITFDFLDQQNNTDVADLPNSFPFTVESSEYSNGILKIRYVVDLPHCPLDIGGIYRSP